MTDTVPVGSPPALPATGPSRARIGELLVERTLVTGEDLDRALELQRRTGRRLGETLVELGCLTSYDLARILAERLGVGFVDLDEQPVDWAVAQRVPEEVARRYRALPVGHRDGAIVIAMADPADVFAVDDVRMFVGSSVLPEAADQQQLASAIDRAYARADLAEHVDDVTMSPDDGLPELPIVLAEAEDAPIVRLVSAIIAQAVDEHASDVHVEPTSGVARIRFRIDGVLRDASEVPLSALRPLVSRLKIMSGIDITRMRIPQDGRFSLKFRHGPVDVRVVTLPTAHGECVVLRLLDQSRSVLTLDAIGLEPEELAGYERVIDAPQGSIAASGPTGSGKTSTVYATLLRLNTPDRNVVAVEDPIEYRIDGAKQVQIDPRAGLTFPIALRSILRADPDVILVGEIRDAETARIATEAALTGHLVLSTIHTTRAAAVPVRLIDMGVEPFLVAAALTCVVNQRLARRLCTDCAAPDVPELAVRQSLGLSEELLDTADIRRAVGCAVCGGTGYRGRTGLFEIMPISDELHRLITARASTAEMERWAVAEGMDTLRMAARRRVMAGQLSIEEMLRVVR